MKIKIDMADNFIDVWDEEEEIWQRYVKINLEDNDDLELLPEDELYEFNKYALLDKERLDFNFRVLKDKINELVKEINEIKKGDEIND